MAGCIYLILAVMIGWKITGSILSEQKMKEKGITALWVRFPGSFWLWDSSADLGCVHSSVGP